MNRAPAIDYGLSEHEDTGCPDGEFPACLQCPLPMCKYEAPYVPPRTDYVGEYPDAVRLIQGGVGIPRVASMLGLNRRKVYRIRDAMRQAGVR